MKQPLTLLALAALIPVFNHCAGLGRTLREARTACYPTVSLREEIESRSNGNQPPYAQRLYRFDPRETDPHLRREMGMACSMSVRDISDVMTQP